MKKLIFSLFSIAAFFVNAADIQVNNSGQSGTYTTITAAINAAATGDRIFISPYNQYTENLSITKSLTLTSAVANTRFSVVGNTTVTSSTNQEVTIIGGEFSGSIIASSGNATLSSKGILTISDCKFNVLTSENYVFTRVLFSENLSTTTIRHGIIAGSKTANIIIPDGPNVNIGDTLRIVGNICGQIQWNNNDNFFHVFNNACSGLIVSNFIYSNTINNRVCNNTFNGGGPYDWVEYATIQFPTPSGSNMSNIVLVNNVIHNGYTVSQNGSTSAVSCGIDNNSNNFSPTNVAVCNSNNGLPKFYYNLIKGSVNFYGNDIVGNVFLGEGQANNITFTEFGKFSTSSQINDQFFVNKGSPSLEFYDLDLTISNIGTSGGPYSIDNYWNTATGRARVFNLEIPFEIWNGNTPTVKADGIHIK